MLGSCLTAKRSLNVLKCFLQTGLKTETESSSEDVLLTHGKIVRCQVELNRTNIHYTATEMQHTHGMTCLKLEQSVALSALGDEHGHQATLIAFSKELNLSKTC